MATHSQKVLRLYRHSLKNTLSWVVDRGLFREHALVLRERFEQGRTERNALKAAELLAAGQVVNYAYDPRPF